MRWLQKWNISQKWLVIGAIVGLLLIFIGGMGADGEAEQSSLDVRVKAYTEQLEKKVAQILEEIDGVSDVHVLLTLEGSSAYIYAMDENGSGGKDHVVLGQGDQEAALLLQEVLSDVRGVSVVCKNGENAEVKRKIIGVLCTGLGIPSNRVFVAGS